MVAFLSLAFAAVGLTAGEMRALRPPPEPPVIRIERPRANDQPVAIKSSEKVTASNGLFRFVETSFTFENPNARPLAADFEFPIPAGATVCGYRLELNGEMVPGVVCEKEKARVAFENEMRKSVDPGLVEQVRGNVWKTRIFPLPAKGRRRAAVICIVAEEKPVDGTVAERCGAYVYEGRVAGAARVPTVAERCAAFSDGWVLWDASRSRKGAVAADLAKLAALPEKGNWKLVVFRDEPSTVRTLATRADLLAALAAEPYDGGTDLAALLAVVPEDGVPKLLFSDEIDTLNVTSPALDNRRDLVFATRPAQAARTISVTRRPYKAGGTEKEGRLLATAWAANRIADLGAQADAHKEEFLALGREFGLASPVTSLLVLERLQQWLEYKIEPPKELAIHAEWVKRRAAEDDPIARKKARADFEKRLLGYWEERVRWWKDPKPKKVTPKSGLFDRLGFASAARSESAAASMDESGAASMDESGAEPEMGCNLVYEANRSVRRKSVGGAQTASAAAATVTLAAWDPKTPYMDALKGAKKGGAYGEYLRQAETYGRSPAFYLDCAGWFFKAGQAAAARRVISNLAEFKLEDAALWRTMGWRLREADAYGEAVRAFRHVLWMRGEEGQSYRDLALVLTERGKAFFACGDKAAAKRDLAEALSLFHKTAFDDHGRRSARRSNDMQVAVMALEELNGLLAWCAAQTWPDGAPAAPAMDEAYRRDLPMDLRVILSWDADETDIDLHVLEPDGEEAFYRHRRTSRGGFIGEDVTTGYGPEEYLRKEADKGVYKILSNYFASHQQALTGAATVTATVYTNWSRKEEKRQTLTLRLDKPKDKQLIGEVTIAE